MKKLIPAVLFLCFNIGVKGQHSVIAIQDFDNAAVPAWSYGGLSLTYASGLSAANESPANSPFGMDTTRAWETTQQSAGVTVSFDTVNVSDYDSVYITFKVAAFSVGSASNGPDLNDYVLASVSINGGVTFYDRLQINGFDASGNNNWAYDATGLAVDTFQANNSKVIYAPAGAGYRTTDGYSTVRIYLPSGTKNVALKIKARESTSQERYCVDNVALMGIPLIQTCKMPCKGWIAQNCSTCIKGCYIDGGTVIPSEILQTASVAADTSNFGYVYWTFDAIADSTYYFDLCSSSGTAGVSWLRLHNAQISGSNYCMNVSNTPTVVLQNKNNGCAATGMGLSKLIWTCQASGMYYLESAVGDKLEQWGSKGSQTAILSYKTLPSVSRVCSGVFYDKGIDGTNGSASNYNNNEDWIYTYFPIDTITDVIGMQFVSFSTSAGDVLCVYNGSSINAPLLGCYSGPSITGAFMSTASNGALTFHFTSDDSLTSGGWEAYIDCPVGSGIKNKSLTNRIKIFPNPVVGKRITISFNENLKKASVKIFNVMGEEAGLISNPSPKEKGTIQVHFDLPSGIYFVRVLDGDAVFTEKLIVQ